MMFKHCLLVTATWEQGDDKAPAWRYSEEGEDGVPSLPEPGSRLIVERENVEHQKSHICPGGRKRVQSYAGNFPSRPYRLAKRRNMSPICWAISPVPHMRVPKSESFSLPPRASRIRPSIL